MDGSLWRSDPLQPGRDAARAAIVSSETVRRRLSDPPRVIDTIAASIASGTATVASGANMLKVTWGGSPPRPGRVLA